MRNMEMARQNTPPDIKWLINQAAVLASEMERIDGDIQILSDKRKKVELDRQACLRILELLTRYERRLALPSVQAHREYGRRGNLRVYLEETLRAAYPHTIDTDCLVGGAIDTFRLGFSSMDDFQRFKDDSIGRALRKLADKGKVEIVGKVYKAPSHFNVWRWNPGISRFSEIVEAMDRLAAIEKE